MSDNAITVVEISASGPEVRARAAEVQEWLLGTGVIKPNESIDPLWRSSLFAPGRSARTAIPGHEQELDQLRTLANSGVDIVTERRIHHPVQNYEPPGCPSCGETIDPDDHHALIDGWLAGAEPTVACTNCGTESLIGDWPGEWTFQVGALAVRFNNWPPIADTFLAEIGRRLGSRWRVVYEHI